MNIISSTNIQLKHLLKWMLLDKEDELRTNLYLLNEDNVKLIDFRKIEDHLSINNFNKAHIHMLHETLQQLIVLCDDHLNKYPIRELQSGEDGAIFTSSSIPEHFRAITLHNERWTHSLSNKQKQDFIDQNLYNIYFYSDILYDLKKLSKLLIALSGIISGHDISSEDQDFSSNSATEKIIMLEKLGVLEFLRTKEPFNLSINALSSALSGITGEKQTTLQSYINPMMSKGTNQRNNPMTKNKAVAKIESRLTNLRFNSMNK